ncbi:MAG: hypothetical protein AAB428_00715 [Patescibacteria group bacterium]
MFGAFLLVFALATTGIAFPIEPQPKESAVEKAIRIEPLGQLAQLADLIAVPFMYLISGTLKEEPQKTHFWNNRQLKSGEVRYLSTEGMVHCKGISGTTSAWPIFHIPILGGWRDYVVLAPTEYTADWYVGWTGKGFTFTGVSRVSIHDAVRMLIGHSDVSFFGVRADGAQINIRMVGAGRIGEGGPFAKKPLL